VCHIRPAHWRFGRGLVRAPDQRAQGGIAGRGWFKGVIGVPGVMEQKATILCISLYLLCFHDTFRATSLVATHTTNGEEENHVCELNSALHEGRIECFHLRYLWKKTFVFLHDFDSRPTDRCFLYACYGNP
jgi:hypothetical protein